MTLLLLGTLFQVSASLRQEVVQFSSKDVLSLREIVAVDGLTYAKWPRSPLYA